MKKLGYLVPLTICAFFLSAWYLRNNKTELRKQDRIIFGTAAGYAPFVSINAQGEYEGFDIDVANEIGQVLDKKIQFKDLGSMAALFTALELGSINAIIWGLSITQERLDKVIMVYYQGEPEHTNPLLFWQEIPAGIGSLSDMQNKTICVEPASSQEALLNQYPFISKLAMEKVDDALMLIQFAKADAALVDPAIAKKFQAKFPAIKSIAIPLDPKDYVEGVGIAIKKDNTAMRETIQQAVDTLRASGTIKTLAKKWGVA